MKQLFPFLILCSWSSCSTFNEDDLIPQQANFLEIETELPIINITVNANDFTQMLNQPDEELEIEGNFNLYRNDALVIKNEAIEMEVKGGFSTKFPLKSLGIKFEDKFDNRDQLLINPPQVLPFHNIDKIKAIRLRNSGSDFRNTMLKDLSITQLAINAGLDLDVTYGEPALVYINEGFYGLLNIRTEGNTNGMAGLYNVKKDKITLAKITTLEFIKKDGDFDRIDKFLEAINRRDIDYINNELDLNNFIDYMIFQSYVGNTDWPHNNARFYAIENQKFRFVLFDLDKVVWLKMNAAPLEVIRGQQTSIIYELFFALYEVDAFKKAFWDRYNFLLTNDRLSHEHFKKIVKYNIQKIENEIPLQIKKYKAPNSKMDWKIELNKLLLLFKERDAIVREKVEVR